MQLHCKSVAVDEQSRLGFEEAVDVLQGSIGRFGVQEVCDWDKGKADDGPNYPEPVAEALDTRQCSLDYSVVTNPLDRQTVC